MIAFVCRFQVILLHGYLNFPTIDDLRQILLDRYKKRGLNDNPYLEDYQTVSEGSSWEGGGPIHLPLIPQDSTIADNYRQYQDLAGIETDSVRNPPKRPRLDSFTSDSLFDTESELSEDSEYTKPPLNETIVTDTVYSNIYNNNESDDE